MISFFFSKSQPLQIDLLKKAVHTTDELKYLLIAILGYCFWIYCAVFACHFTSILQVASLANSQFLLLDVLNMIQG